MLQEHARIVDFIATAEGVTGRKKLQKMVYIMKKLNVPFKEKYEFHIYGPYSEELTARIEELCDMGFLSEALEDKGSYVQYKYAVTDEGMEFRNAVAASIPKILKPLLCSMPKARVSWNWPRRFYTSTI